MTALQVGEPTAEGERSVRPCPVCHGTEARFHHRQRYALFDDSRLPASTDIVSCAVCGMVYARSEATARDYTAHYAVHSIYANSAASGSGLSSLDSERLRITAARLVEWIGTDASVIDIGAGRGGLLSQLARAGLNRLVGVDPSPSCVRAMLDQGFAACQGTLEEGLNLAQHASFDAAILSHVLEHVYDAQRALYDLAPYVAKDGAVYIEVPDADRYTVERFPPFYFFDPEHINHFDAARLAELARRAGWNIVEAWPRSIEVSPGLPYPAVGVLLRRSGPARPAPVSGSIDRYIDACVRAQAHDRSQSRLDAILSRASPVVVWGAGSHAQRLLAASSARKPVFIIDSDPAKQGRLLAGVTVVTPEEGLARAMNLNATVVCAIATDPSPLLARLRAACPQLEVIVA